MKSRIAAAAVFVCLIVIGSPRMRADEGWDDLEQIPSCGTATIDHELWQYSIGQLYVFGYAQTRRNLDGCLSRLQVEAWVQGIVMPTAIASNWGSGVSVSFGAPVPSYGTWNSVSKHWLINGGVSWQFIGWGHGQASVVPRTTSTVSPCDNNEPCAAPSGGGTPDSPSPILVDVNGDGYDLTSAADGVLFDIDADGALDRVAWTAAGSDDAWLAMDRNGNGTIDDGSELFGNFTPAYPNQHERLSKNGFDALKFLEGPDYGPSYGDAVIDARDSIYRRLLLWTDRNHNGISEPDELVPLSAAGVLSISTDYKVSRRRDRNGNLFLQRAKSVVNARGVPVSRYVYDVWLSAIAR